MTAHALVTGTIFRDPEQKSSAKGNPFVAATLKVKDGDATQWWKILAFSETAKSELVRLGADEAVAVQGSFKCDVYTPEGKEPRVNLTIFADNVVALRAAAKARKAKVPSSHDATQAPAGPAAWEDDIPFMRP